jgi:hypothetical protein
MFGNKKEAARQVKYQYLCAANNMEYLGEDSFGVKSLLKYFELFKSKRGKIRNLSQLKLATMEEDIHLFDFKYTVSTGKTHHTYDQTVFFINSKNLGLPEFRMKPENIGHKIAAYFGWEDIDFEAYPAFSEKYHLSGEHEEFIRHTFDDKILKFFSKTSGWTIEAANYYLIFYAHSSLVPENILPDFFRLGMGVYDLFKEEIKEKS